MYLSFHSLDTPQGLWSGCYFLLDASLLDLLVAPAYHSGKSQLIVTLPSWMGTEAAPITPTPSANSIIARLLLSAGCCSSSGIPTGL